MAEQQKIVKSISDFVVDTLYKACTREHYDGDYPGWETAKAVTYGDILSMDEGQFLVREAYSKDTQEWEYAVHNKFPRILILDRLRKESRDCGWDWDWERDFIGHMSYWDDILRRTRHGYSVIRCSVFAKGWDEQFNPVWVQPFLKRETIKEVIIM